MTSSRIYALLALLLLAEAAALHAKTTPNLVSILTRRKKYGTLLKLLKTTNLVTAVEDQLKNNPDGITLFAPTDAAFGKLPPGALANLTLAQATYILQLHALPEFYSFGNLRKVKKPIETFAEGSSLKVTLSRKKVFISSGPVTTPLKKSLYKKFPLSLFTIGDVLIPNVK
uniref:Fasciclin-like arabinogalactan protein n=1 Tax=Wolffia australiana TaxID=161112 RepID=H6UGX8_WOLAU|nr:fasciclin-like arabinogalactan protein [Wolffia australiana]